MTATWLPHAPLGCVSPSFPVVEIAGRPNARWIQTIHDKDSSDREGFFVDGVPNTFPFYNDGSVFWDTPNYRFGLFTRNTTSFEAHAYAVEQDGQRVRVLGGVSWGFVKAPWPIPVAMVEPAPISRETFEGGDLSLLKRQFKDWQFE